MKQQVGVEVGGVVRGGVRRRRAVALATLALTLAALGSGAPAAMAATPPASVSGVSAVGITSAHLTGEVGPTTLTTYYGFEFSTDEANWIRGPLAYYGGNPTVDPQDPPAALAVSEDLTGLVADTKYFVRIGTYDEEDFTEHFSSAPYLSFTTQAIANDPTLALDPPSEVKFTSAQISGTVDPEGGNVNPGDNPVPIFWQLQVNREGAGWETPEGAAGTIEGDPAKESNPVKVEASLSGLPNSTEYKVRLLVSYAGKEAISSEGSFETQTVTPPSVEANDASLLTGTSAHFSGKVTPGNLDPAFNATTCAFDYVPLARSEHQRLKVEASGGAFKLSFEGQETPQLPFNASAAEVAGALQALSTVGPGGVSVAGGGGIHPYLIGFGGSLANKNVPEIEAITKVNIPSSATPVSILTGTAAVTTSLQGSDGEFASAVAAPCDVEPIEGTSPVEVKADVTGLEPHTTYRLRLRAENQGGSGTDTAADFTTEAVAPAILETAVRDVGLGSATLQAEINPGGDATTYHFEYLSAAAYNNASGSFAGATPTPESGSIGAGNEGQAADAPIDGLEPGTDYRYRVVATNSKSAPGGTAGPVRSFTTTATSVAAGESCPNRAVREQQGSTYLPECRAYEIVNSPGLDLGEVNRVSNISDDGKYAAVMSVVPGHEALSAGVASTTVAHRTPTGWAQSAADPVAIGGFDKTGLTVPKIFSTDFSRALVVTSLPGDPEDVNSQGDIYRVDVGVGTSKWMSSLQYAGAVIGGTPDLGRIVFWSVDNHLYATNGDSVELLTVDENGTPFAIGSPAPAGAAYQRGLVYGEERDTWPWVERGGSHGTSDDTLRTYFYTLRDSPGGPGRLYLRDLTGSKPRTIAISVSERAGDSGGALKGRFISASHDGSTAYLESPFQLTEDAAPGGGIYRFDLASESLTLLTPDPGRPTGLEIGSAMSSDDQSHIYFTSTADLGGGAVVGANNAYVWTQVDGTRFIATANAGARIDRVTPDGRYALMLSSASVRGAPNNGHVALYEYSYAEDEMDCVSCRPDGSPSKGDASIEAQSAGFPSDITHGRALSFDGRVFFDSADRLVARDENSAMDVYVYDEGKLSLLTTGRENTSSFVAENSDDGQHVFIYTRAALVGADRDAREFDVYDLAVGGGFLEPLPPAAPCQGESCRVGSSARPDAVVLRSSGFSGAGNPMPCAKGKSRRNGHCVKVRRHRRKHAASKNPKRDANRNGKTGR